MSQQTSATTLGNALPIFRVENLSASIGSDPKARCIAGYAGVSLCNETFGRLDAGRECVEWRSEP